MCLFGNNKYLKSILCGNVKIGYELVLTVSGRIRNPARKHDAPLEIHLQLMSRRSTISSGTASNQLEGHARSDIVHPDSWPVTIKQQIFMRTLVTDK